jgi:PAS domain-containing protein
MILLLQEETERALDEGYSALRVTGEMTWALRGLAGSNRLIEYEAKLNDFFLDSKCLAICQYDRRQFAPALLLDVLATHPIAVIGTEIFDNFYYMPPEDFLGPDPEVTKLNNWVNSLVERKQAEEVLRLERDKLETITRNIGIGLAIISKDYRTLWANKVLKEIFGEVEGKICHLTYRACA